MTNAKTAITLAAVVMALLLAATHGAGLEPRSHPARVGRLFVACNYTENPGASCWDCDTVLICTKIGGILKPCWWPGSRNCVAGACGPEPSDECASATTGTTGASPAPTDETTPATPPSFDSPVMPAGLKANRFI